jgi:predicted enzyme involved in methoxymalonyl-ACP biosynthesis
MLDALASEARARGARKLIGYYLPTKKNGMVADHYDKLGFTRIATSQDGSVTYSLDLADYEPRTTHIQVTAPSA